MIRDRLVLSLCLSGTPPPKIDRICELFVYVKPFLFLYVIYVMPFLRQGVDMF